MRPETSSAIHTLLESALEKAEDHEVRYELRTALQYLFVQENEIHQLREAARENPELEEELSSMGYIE